MAMTATLPLSEQDQLFRKCSYPITLVPNVQSGGEALIWIFTSPPSRRQTAERARLLVFRCCRRSFREETVKHSSASPCPGSISSNSIFSSPAPRRSSSISNPHRVRSTSLRLNISCRSVIAFAQRRPRSSIANTVDNGRIYTHYCNQSNSRHLVNIPRALPTLHAPHGRVPI